MTLDPTLFRSEGLISWGWLHGAQSICDVRGPRGYNLCTCRFHLSDFSKQT